MAKQCQNFAVDLLDQVRGSKELEVLLNYDKYGPVRKQADRMDLARVKLAINLKQKKVNEAIATKLAWEMEFLDCF